MEGPLLRLLILSRSVNKHGHHRQFLFLVGQFLNIFSETRRHNELLLCGNDVWEILYKISIFRAAHRTNMDAINSSCLLLATKNLL